jgi:hypothetical protein
MFDGTRLFGPALLLAFLTSHACGGKSEPTPSDDGSIADGAGTPSTLSEDQLQQACVRLHTCGIQNHVRLGDCVNDFHNRLVLIGQRTLYEALYACVNQGAGDCKIVRECMGIAGKPVVCDGQYQASCKGTVAYNCDLIANWEQGLDCGKGGKVCVVANAGSSKEAVCAMGSCDPSSYAARCEDGRLLKCTGGAVVVDDCPERQLQCRDGKAGVCEGTGRSCAPVQSACDGNVLVSCVGGYRSDVDCSTLFGDKTCDPGTASCIGAGTQCSTDSFFDTCEGDDLVACIDGTEKTFACRALGFLGCEKKTYGAICRAEHVYE